MKLLRSGRHAARAAALVLALGLLSATASPAAQPRAASPADSLLEIDIARLQEGYLRRRYTVTEVVRWHLARVHRYNGGYRALETVMERQALAEAARADAELPHLHELPPLWGVPIVIKANTSIKGEVTTDGWAGFRIPGHELVAPRDAAIVARLRAAGAIILGHTNMPDFANSDTNRSSSFGRTGNAYDVRFSPGGSSGGTVTAVTANFAVLGTGTDTGNSIRMPAATSAVVGVFPTRGLVSIAGIAPLDWLLDNTGPIARSVRDAAVALGVMAGEDPLDPRTAQSARNAQPGPYTRYLNTQALKGRRFGVPAFVLAGTGIPFHGISPECPPEAAAQLIADATVPLDERTRAVFLKAIEELRAAGATVVFDDGLLNEGFAVLARHIATYAYVREGTEHFLAEYGPPQYRSAAAYLQVVGAELGEPLLGTQAYFARLGRFTVQQKTLESDPQAEGTYQMPRRQALAAYLEGLDRLNLDGYVYPAIQMPPPDETLPQGGHVSDGPHSATSWVNMLGVPAVVVVGGFYPGGLPFGLEISGRPWKDGDLLGYAFAYEQATHHRRPPTLIEQGLLPYAP